MRTEPQDELHAKLDQNLEISKKILESAEKTRKYILMQSIGSWIRTILWLIPFALAAIFLPPLMGKINALYQSILGSEAGGIRVNLEDLKQIVNLQTK
ncbi:hypothetical protein A3F28_03115 [Candidatus Uhrbacteria bacterium RIFCSPHIGHO2_12_FULL_57_11]|uniref:Uncharacterized protein n=3 Tax=Parcubacteria group TaxID=1794811 RepID=A0A1F7UIU9_9BACT|nr:MAG: hypothetical protein A2704_00995 [Candidatus Kaiserbacteria bacterium RIFCSPHIGHO2_01_FULL_54_36b]OGL72819.1 MAG: hypothetical protein A3D72_02010 [Candidatus Uhrbacteria bacterium RIFCSPHIGHO2_02_FULL_57_19]OGL77657.1 MAG: hypothetical protein A3F28_03115 [Candidatus Uhrbacteria bacterium RIFCSPHIGHO2_12_FULL_57_11]